jgi:ABC-type sugar transport system ATPase subunit/ribose/xylose/arabinose/galactoside ABC-type transport system permease subunit
MVFCAGLWAVARERHKTIPHERSNRKTEALFGMSGLVELRRVSKSFPGVMALTEVDLTLRAGSIHALVGENGAGKSTLINLLSGVLVPDGGDIVIDGQPVQLGNPRAARRNGIVTVHQEADLFPDLSIAENMGLEQGLPGRLGWIAWWTQWRRTRAALALVGAELSPYRPAGTLTHAQRQLVEIAAAMSQAARVLILDEPTSSLSDSEAHVLFSHLRRFREQGTAILYISHRLEEIFALADETTVLRDGRRVWTGPLNESSPRHLIAQMVGREVASAARPSARERGPIRLSCRALTAADGSFADVSLDVRAGEILGLYGLIGAGRTEWGQAVIGLRRVAHGELQVEGQPVRPSGPGRMIQHGVGYLPEDRLRQGLCRGLSVRANTVLAYLRRIAPVLWVSRSEETLRTRATVEQLAIKLRDIEQAAGTLSGGNQQKVVLGRWLGCDPKVLILDEPTRGVDVGAKAEIHALIHRLADQGRAIVLISSDLTEVLAQSDRVGVFREGRLVEIVDPRQSPAEEVAAAATPTGARSAERKMLRTSRLAITEALLHEAALPTVILALTVFLLIWTRQVPDLTDAALLFLCAAGAAIVILAGGLDISLGALMALSAGVAGRLWEQGRPLPVVVGTALLLGGAGGMLNATVSLIGRVHPIVVTLGAMSLYRGLTLWWLKEDVQIPNEMRGDLFAEALGLPVIVWAGLALAVLCWVVLNWHVWGRELYALGGNPSAAHRVRISKAKVWLMAFTVQGLLAGLAGLLYLARSGSLQPTSYEDKTLEAIAAAVVGGVAITGGRGSIWGVAFGCVFLVMLGPACQFLHISPNWQRALVGGVMVAAVLTDTLWRRRET